MGTIGYPDLTYNGMKLESLDTIVLVIVEKADAVHTT